MPAKRWFQRAGLSVSLVVAGVGMLFMSWILPQDQDWWSGVLVEIGVTVMLLIPLLFLSGVVERQFRGLRESQAEIEATQVQTSERLDQLAFDVAQTREQVNRTREELSETMRERLSQRAVAERAAVDALESNPTMAATRDALKRATELNLIHDFGICIPVGRSMPLGGNTYLRFMPVPTPTDLGSWGDEHAYHPESELVCRLGLDKHMSAELLWDKDQSVEEFLETLAIKLRAEDRYPGDDEFSKESPLVALKEVLGCALEDNRSGSESGGLREIIMYTSSGWVITPYDLINIRDDNRSRKSLYDIKAILDANFQEREHAIARWLVGIPRVQARYLVNVVSDLIHKEILNFDDIPF